MIENYMVMPQYRYGLTEKQIEEFDEVWAQKEDIAWDDIRDGNL